MNTRRLPNLGQPLSVDDHRMETMHVDEEIRPANFLDVVAPDQVEASIQAKYIGDRIRRLRIKRSMGLVDLGTKTGLSASFLSQLETGRVVPTVRNLARIAIVFNKDLSYFFRDEQPVTFRIMRHSERVRIQRNNGAAPSFSSDSMSSLIADNSMVPCIAEFHAVGEEVTFRPRLFEGVEFTLITEGALHLVSESETRILETGDVLWIDAMRKREYICAVGNEAKAMIITRPHRN